MFDEVLTDIISHEKENGHTDLWRRTIMKFYNRILGNRDYTLFEVVHHGLRLPAVISSFGDVFNASLSSWRAVRPPRETSEDADEENLLTPN